MAKRLSWKSALLILATGAVLGFYGCLTTSVQRVLVGIVID